MVVYTYFRTERSKALRNTTNWVPFVLQKDRNVVQVDQPTEAYDLEEQLTIIYDHYSPQQGSFSQNVMDWISGDKTKGIEEVESLLMEGTRLNAVGELVIENNTIHIRPPSNGALYILTTLSHAELVKSFEAKSWWFKIFTVVFGLVGVSVLVVYLERLYRKMQIRRDAERNRERVEEYRRRLASQHNDRVERQNPELQICVICLTNPRETVLLDCGHVCLCYDCVDMLPTMHCPICRANITRIVPTFLS